MDVGHRHRLGAHRASGEEWARFDVVALKHGWVEQLRLVQTAVLAAPAHGARLHEPH
jgi:hypothetical protein